MEGDSISQNFDGPPGNQNGPALLSVQPIPVEPSNLFQDDSIEQIDTIPAPRPHTRIEILNVIREDLTAELIKRSRCLLKLNRSRKQEIYIHLQTLLGQSPDLTFVDPLNHWMTQTPYAAQIPCLRAYFSEVVSIALAEAVLLKAWDLRGQRKLQLEDLSQLNWAMSSALKPYLSLKADSWQLTRPNTYSWYNPPSEFCSRIWDFLDTLDLSQTSEQVLEELLITPSTASRAELDSRFYEVLWENLPRFGLKPNIEAVDSSLIRERFAFTPTLGSGTITRTTSSEWTWYGMDRSLFRLIQAELSQLWWGPSSPQTWALGTGLEVMTRDQTNFNSFLKSANKQTNLEKVSEMEAFELAFIDEVQTESLNQKSFEFSKIKSSVDACTTLSRLKSNRTSLGSLQASVAMTKLRPKGLLFWARNDLLEQSHGQGMLQFLLERAKLVAEWNLSELEHSLPTQHRLFPKVLYLFSREVDIQSRLLNRPLRVFARGKIRSHVELPLLISDLMQTVSQNEMGFDLPKRNNWQIQVQKSPTIQKEWADRWPEQLQSQELHLLDALKSHSVPLSQIATVRTQLSNLRLNQSFLEVQLGTKENQKLEVHLRRDAQTADSKSFCIFMGDEYWLAPMKAYLESEAVQLWFDTHAEKRNDKWVLSEQLFKILPIPAGLAETLLKTSFDHDIYQVGNVQNLENLMTADPEKIPTLLTKGTPTREDWTSVFIAASTERENLKISQRQLFSLVKDDGTIQWRNFVQILPPSERVSLTIHSSVRFNGYLPPHQPVLYVQRTKRPEAGIRFQTETGFTCLVSAGDDLYLDWIYDQVSALETPTWSEIVKVVTIPRNIELAQSTAHEILRGYGEVQKKLKALDQILLSCQIL